MPKKDRTGERFTTKEGYEIVIVEYNNNKDLWIEFQDEHKTITHSTYNACQNGSVKNPYHPSVHGIGYIGQGEYRCSINREVTKEYLEWSSLLARGYSEKFKNYRPSYKDIYVNECWYNFQNYCKWREDNYYEIEGETMCLDKDILVKGNKEYAPDKCIFVPNRINVLFINRSNDRGGYPIGVTYDKRKNIYEARCSINEKHQKNLGYYNTPHEAFLAYKTFKEAYIKEVADEYKGKIPDRLYEAMYAWEVEEDD